MQRLILSSTSKPRQELLRRLQIPFEITAPDVDETPLANETPTELVLRLAEKKARVVAEKFPDALIIGADQVGVLANVILCKPLNYENAIAQLKLMGGRRVEFLIGLCLLNAKNNSVETVLEKFAVKFRPLTSEMIETYLQKEQPLQCTGSFRAEGLGIALVEEFDGKDFTALIGLPLVRLTTLLENVGFGPLVNRAAN